MTVTTSATEPPQAAGIHEEPRGAERAKRRRLQAARMAVPIGFLVLWLTVSPLTELVPAPFATIAELANGFLSGWIYEGLVATASAVLMGFLLGTAAAFPIGYLLGRSTGLRRIFDPLIAGTFAVPRIILYPVLLAVFGVGLEAETGMVAISAFFPILMATTASVKQVSESLLKLGRSLRASRLQTAAKIVIPDAAPGIMVGIRIGFSISFIAAIIAEFFAAKDGLGLMISEAYASLELARMYAIVLLILVIASGGNLVLWWLERRLRHG